MGVTERDVERYFARRGESLGAVVLKLTSPGSAGVPDRLVLFPDGAHALVEVKAPGKGPRPLQERTFRRLGAAGHPVTVVDSKERALRFWGDNARHLCGGGGAP